MRLSRFVKPLLLCIIACIVVFLIAIAIYEDAPSELDGTVAMEERAMAAEPDTTAVVDEYGLNAGTMQTLEERVRRNDTFSSILSAFDVSPEKIALIAHQSRTVFDVRSIQAGKQYRIYHDDSLQTVRYVVYEQDPIRYVVFDLADSVRVYEGQRTVTTRQRVAEGTIENSLAQALSAQNASPVLATALAEVYAWQIDFYRIQKKDFFKVIYEEHLIDGQPVGIGRVLAARFNHANEDYYAFFFENDAVRDYYDEHGQSLRKAFLKAPLKYSRISSRYTTRRFHPVQKRYKAHLGTDYAAAPGTPILTTGDGVVVEAGYKRNNGNYVKIRHNNTYTTGYLHMSRIGKGIKRGAQVRQGDVIGYVGSTGLATGPHVCYRFWKNGKQVDPLREAIPPSHPVADEYRMAFTTLKGHMMRLLQVPSTLYVDSDNVTSRARELAS